MGMTISSPDDCTEGKMARSASAAAAACRRADRQSAATVGHTPALLKSANQQIQGEVLRRLRAGH